MTIYSDLSTGLLTGRNQYMERITDPGQHQKDKMEDYRRNTTIAGFNCRRANAMIMDSVYVVHFIPTKSGSEPHHWASGHDPCLALPHEAYHLVCHQG